MARSAPSAGLVAPAAEPTKPTAGTTPDGNTLASLVRRSEQQIATALPRHIPADRFARVAVTALRSTTNLDQCTAASFLGCLMTAAQLGLEPNTPLGHAYLIPFRDRNAGVFECTFILGYKGIVDLARRNGVTVVARTVYEGDEFEFEYGLTEKCEHRPTLTERGEPRAYYGVARWADGHLLHLALPKDIEDRKGRSKAASSGPWKTDYDAMARKTVIRMMAPFLPLSIEMATAITRDETTVHYDLERGDFIDVASDDETTESTPAAPCATCNDTKQITVGEGDEAHAEPCPDCAEVTE